MKKIAFIIYYKNEIIRDECIFYINRLHVPADFETDIITVTDTDSICEAYNAGMKSSDADIKVYIRENVFIINRNFIPDINDIFKSDSESGLLGILGWNKLPDEAHYHRNWNYGSVYIQNNIMDKPALDKGVIFGSRAECFKAEEYENDIISQAEALDGALLVSNTDIEWREDILKGCECFDIAASVEYKRRGYRLNVICSKEPWCHMDINGFNPDDANIYYDEVFRKEYPEIKSEDSRVNDIDRIRLKNESIDMNISKRLISMMKKDIVNAHLYRAIEKKELFTRLRGGDTTRLIPVR